MIGEITSAVYYAVQLHELLRTGKAKEMTVEILDDADVETIGKWTEIVRKIAIREYTTADDILFELYGYNYQSQTPRSEWALMDMVLTMTNALLDAHDNFNGKDWRDELKG